MSLRSRASRSTRGRAVLIPVFIDRTRGNDAGAVQATFPRGWIEKELDMSGYLNRVQLIGNLGRDPEVRTTQTGKTVATLVIATGESWKDERGNRVEKTEWHRIVIFSEWLGQIAEKYLEKGSKVYLEGKLCTRKWQDQSGADRYSTEIHLTPYNGVLIFLDGRRDGGPAATASTADGRTGAVAGTRGNLDDDIPF